MFNFQDVNFNESEEYYIMKDSKTQKLGNNKEKNVLKVNIKDMMPNNSVSMESDESYKSFSSGSAEMSGIQTNSPFDNSYTSSIPVPPANYKHESVKYPNFFSKIPKNF